MLRERFGLECREARQIHGRPSAPLREVRFLGNILGLLQLLVANLRRNRPYVLSYNLSVAPGVWAGQY